MILENVSIVSVLGNRGAPTGMLASGSFGVEKDSADGSAVVNQLTAN